MRFKPLILVCGADEVGTAVAHRLFRAQFRVLITASDDPLTLFKGNAFSQAAFTSSFEVEGVSARKAVVTEAVGLIDRNLIPLLTADSKSVIDVLNPEIVIDARSPQRKGEISVGDASLVIGIGSVFEAGTDCDFAIHADRGHDLGRIIFRGSLPLFAASLEDRKEKKLIKARKAGVFAPLKRLGQRVEEGEALARTGALEVISSTGGVISGFLQEGALVPEGAVVAEVDQAGVEDCCFTLSDQVRSISGGVLECVVAWVADVGAFPYH